jgi:IclR family transcriptional regulator, KDG regulon repressor
MLNTVMRAGAVLDLFTPEEPEWGVSATAGRLGIANSTAHDVLVSLAGIGLLQRVGHGRYRLGWRTLSLASVLLRTSDLKLKAAPILQRLAEHQRAGVRLVAWDRGDVVCIDRRRPQSRPSARAEVDRGAGTRVLLANRPHDEVDLLWEQSAIGADHLSLDELRAELEQIRAQGWAADRRCGAVAAPVRDARSAVVAALELELPDAGEPSDPRFHLRAVVAAASRISASLCDLEPAGRVTPRRMDVVEVETSAEVVSR